MYREQLPEGCPLETAEEITTTRQVYRLVRTDPPTNTDFKSLRALNTFTGPFREAEMECRAHGLSVFCSREDADEKRMLPQISRLAALYDSARSRGRPYRTQRVGDALHLVAAGCVRCSTYMPCRGHVTRLRYVDTLVYCDGPQVFAARDAIGGNYVAVMGPSDTETRYLVVGVAPEELRAFRAGERDLLELVMGSYADFRYTTASMPLSADDELAVEVFEGRLEQSEFLPAPGFVLKNRPSEDLAARISERSNLRLELTLAAMNRIGTTAYTELLNRVQILVKNAAVATATEAAGRYPIRLRDDMFDVVVPALSGSFRVLLEASSLQEPEISTRMAVALRRIDTLFRYSADTARVLEAARANPRRLTGAYLKLLQLLAKNKTSLSYAWTAAHEVQSHRGAVSSTQADALIRALSKDNLGSTTVVLDGKLYRCNSGTRFWGMRTDDYGSLRGRVRADGPDLDGLRLGGRYRFTCDIEYDFAAGSSILGGLLYLIHQEPL